MRRIVVVQIFGREPFFHLRDIFKIVQIGKDGMGVAGDAQFRQRSESRVCGVHPRPELVWKFSAENCHKYNMERQRNYKFKVCLVQGKMIKIITI